MQVFFSLAEAEEMLITVRVCVELSRALNLHLSGKDFKALSSGLSV